MDLKRVLTSVFGLPIVILTIIYGNKYVIDIILTIIAAICMYEYLDVIKKVAHPIKWISYASIICIALTSIISLEILLKIVISAVPIILVILFARVITTEMKTNLKDVAYTFLGICYVTFFILFLALIRGFSNVDTFNKILMGYVLVVAWSTDIFAYLVGKNWGKHKFSKISPKKSIEGCIAGIIGAIICSIIYWAVINKIVNITYWDYNVINLMCKFITPWILTIITLILSIISQIGDFMASSIKRFADVKDFGNILPGHGGMLDRIDSLICISPFIYILISILI